MYIISNDKIRNLLTEITPWIIGSKGSEDNYAPIFKENTPENIKLKHREFVKLCKSEFN